MQVPGLPVPDDTNIQIDPEEKIQEILPGSDSPLPGNDAPLFGNGGTACDSSIGSSTSDEQIAAIVEEAVDNQQPIKEKIEYEQHHLFPQEFEEYFDNAGIKIHRWTVRLPKDYHQEWIHGFRSTEGQGGWWNARWRNFIQQNPIDPLVDDIMDQMHGMRSFWGIDQLRISRYYTK